MGIRVLVVDDSLVVRSVLTRELAAEPDIEVVGAAPDPFVAREMILAQRPDVITLDMEMPRMDGLTFLRKVMYYHPLPVIVVSSLTAAGSTVAVEALRAGAVDVVGKPSSGDTAGLRTELVAKIRHAAQAKVRQITAPLAPAPTSAKAPVAPKPVGPVSAGKLIAIGASTGGPQALEAVLTALPAEAPAVVIVQHMPPGFTQTFADRLDTMCAIRVREAADGDALRPGTALIAPGGYHLIVRGHPGDYQAQVREGPLVSQHRPSVDVLFRSVAKAAGSRAVGVLMTGMGRDGARGLLEIREARGFTIAQDEATSVVYGMPREAVEIGAAMRIEPLERIATAALYGQARSREG
jgi:two-component system chemotaxis response regulator CheB